MHGRTEVAAFKVHFNRRFRRGNRPKDRSPHGRMSRYSLPLLVTLKLPTYALTAVITRISLACMFIHAGSTSLKI